MNKKDQEWVKAQDKALMDSLQKWVADYINADPPGFNFVRANQLHTFREELRTELNDLAIVPIRKVEARVTNLQDAHNALSARTPVVLAGTNAITQAGDNEFASLDGADLAVVSVVRGEPMREGRGAVLVLRGESVQLVGANPLAFSAQFQLTVDGRLLARSERGLRAHYLIVKY